MEKMVKELTLPNEGRTVAYDISHIIVSYNKTTCFHIHMVVVMQEKRDTKVQ